MNRCVALKFLILFLSISACKNPLDQKSKDEKSAAEKASATQTIFKTFLNPSEFLNIQGQLVKSADELIAAVQEDSAMYANQPKKMGPDYCSDAFSQIKYVGDSKHVSAGGVLDLSNCTKAENKHISFTRIQATYKIFADIQCANGDLSQMINLSILNDSALPNAPNNGQCAFVINSELTLDYSGTEIGEQGRVTVDAKKRWIRALSRKDGSPCISSFNNRVETFDDMCFDRTLDVTSDYRINGQESPEYRKPALTEISYLGVAKNWARKDTWYDRGAVHYEGLGWIGDVTYMNSTTPPTYVFRSGSELKTGTLVATAASLTDSGDSKPCVSMSGSRFLGMRSSCISLTPR